MAQDLHDGKIKTSDLNESFVHQTYQKLSGGAGTGYSKDFNIVDSKGIPNPRITKMKQNLYKFSAAKNAAMLQDINSRMYDGNRLRSLQELKGDLDKLNIKYNKNWLEAEYRTARQSGHMAQQWEAYQHNKTLFPNLKYKTQEDSRVRPEHEALNNIIAPIGSPFWDKYYPPNGWRCRCYVVQTAEPATRDIPETTPDVKPEFEINVGQSGQIFNEDSKTGHKFFALAKQTPGWEKRFEMSKQEGPYETYKTAKAKVDMNIYADEKDLPANLNKGLQMSEQMDINVRIRPHTILDGWRNPEYLLDELVADLYQGDIKLGFKKKRTQIKTFIHQHNLSFPKKVSEQYAIAFDISKIEKFGYDVARRVNGELKSDSRLSFVVILNKSESVRIDRTDDYPTIQQKVNKIAKAR